jgi:hypothetical protein
VEEWYQLRLEVLPGTVSRRPTRVLRKPKVAVPAPVHRLIAPRPTLDSVRTACLTHREHCRACANRTWCADGKRLASAYVDLLGQEPKRSEVIARTSRQEQQLQQQLARRAREQRPQEWARVLPAVEAADKRRVPAVGTVVMPIKGAGLPSGTPTTGTDIDRKRQEARQKSA